LLVVSLVVTILQTAATDVERAVLYRFLAQASAEIPEVVAMM
jgi:neurofibromin 1